MLSTTPWTSSTLYPSPIELLRFTTKSSSTTSWYNSQIIIRTIGKEEVPWIIVVQVLVNKMCQGRARGATSPIHCTRPKDKIKVYWGFHPVTMTQAQSKKGKQSQSTISRMTSRRQRNASSRRIKRVPRSSLFIMVLGRPGLRPSLRRTARKSVMHG